MTHFRFAVATGAYPCLMSDEQRRWYILEGWMMETVRSLLLLCTIGCFIAAAQVPSNGLVGWWRFDEISGVTVADSSGNGNVGTLSGGYTRVSGRIGEAISFSGGALIGTDPASKFPVGSGALTFTSWIKMAGPVGASVGVFNIGTGPGAAFSVELFNNTVTIGLYGANGAGRLNGSKSVTDGAWHHIAAVYTGPSGNRLQIYVDGTLDREGSATMATGAPPTWRIGQFLNGSGAFQGLMDEVRLYNRGLSTAEIQSVYTDSEASPVTKILPQLAFGGGWYTALYFTNTKTAPVSFSVTFTGNDGNPLSMPAFGRSSETISLAGRGTAIIEAPDVGPLVQGYVTASVPAGVTGYGVFRQSISGLTDQEAVVPLSGNTATTSSLLFDDTKYVTGVAVVNLASVYNAINVTARDDRGNMLGSGTISLAPNAKTALVLRNIPGLAGVAGAVGSAEFTAAIGNLGVLGLRFNGAAFTSIPTSDR